MRLLCDCLVATAAAVRNILPAIVSLPPGAPLALPTQGWAHEKPGKPQNSFNGAIRSAQTMPTPPACWGANSRAASTPQHTVVWPGLMWYS